MKRISGIRLLPALGAALLVSCGGIEGTGSPQAAIEGTGVTSSGGVSGFGSVFVNGVEYATERADIVVEGAPAEEAALHVGMVVTVTGVLAKDGVTGNAQRVEFDRPLFGPVDGVDADARSATVLGQALLFDDATLFEVTAEEEIAEGQTCFASGHLDGAGALRATLVRCTADYIAGVTEVEREGVVSQLDTGARSFRLGDQPIDFAGAALDSTAGPLADGARVEVLGVQRQRGGLIEAARVRVKRVALKPGDHVSLQGVIGRFASLADFEIERRQVDAAGAQRTDSHQVTPGSGLRALVDGTVRADGVIAAARYALLPATDVLLTGRVDDVDAGRDLLTVFGMPRRALAITQYQDRRTGGERRFRLRDLRRGHYVELRGFREPDGHTVITRVERRDERPPEGGTLGLRFRIGIGESDPAAGQVRGPLDSADLVQNRMVIVGVTVETDNARTEFLGRDGEMLAGPQFYNDLQPGDRLEAEGNESDDVILATRVRHVR